MLWWYGTSFIFHLYDLHIIEARRTPRLRSPGIRLSFGLDCFREENQKAMQQITQRRLHHAAVRLILTHDTFMGKIKYPSLNVFRTLQFDDLRSPCRCGTTELLNLYKMWKNPSNEGY